jgi:phosphoribosylformimino-5-aminoimidazole carboxamide ribotide isomerase
VAGWEESGALTDTALAAAARGYGVCGIVYTSIARDGTMGGPDILRTNAVAAAGLPVLLSGGVGDAADVARVVAERAPGVEGVIIGKALYEGRVDLADLIARYQRSLDASRW